MLHLCAFCNEPLPKTNRPTFNGQVELCPRCGVAYTVAPDIESANAALATHLDLPTKKMTSATLTLGEGRILAVGWNPAELLSALQIARLTRKSKPIVQEHLRAGRFEGAIKTVTPGGARAWPGWAVPRASVRAYMLAGRKPYVLSPEGKARKGKPPKKKPSAYVLSREEIIEALREIGQRAAQQDQMVKLVVVGGAAMVLAHSARNATRDLDAIIVAPSNVGFVRELARAVALERGWPEDWLNDGAKGYLVSVSDGPVVVSLPGIEVRTPKPEQLLAMKLCAWRDETDFSDARQLLQSLSPAMNKEKLWADVEKYLIPGRELKAHYAFDELWETR